MLICYCVLVLFCVVVGGLYVYVECIVIWWL